MTIFRPVLKYFQGSQAVYLKTKLPGPAASEASEG
jgi:hypothetical protein